SDDLKDKLRPDLLITFGQSLISKNVKLFLRKYSPQEHWHIQPGGSAADTFKHLTDIFHISPSAFFDFLNSPDARVHAGQQSYNALWESEEQRTKNSLSGFFSTQEFAEMELVREVIENLPDECDLHLANSMSVRYANFIGLKASQKGVRVFSNRGTS